jgi:hypothetical protein
MASRYLWLLVVGIRFLVLPWLGLRHVLFDVG